MRFTNQNGLLQVLKYSSQRLTRIMIAPVTNAYRKVYRVLNPNGFTTRIMSDVRKGSKELLSGQPQSLKDYFAIGNYYIAKKLALLVAVALILLPVLYLKYIHPILLTNFLTNTMVINSAEMAGYNGKVKLLSADGGTVLYRGPLVEGRITGEGSLYDYDGNLVYQGNFLKERYDGSGQTFWANGNTHYVGSFSENEYDGAGKLYNENGGLIYQGNFASGRYEGYGREYDGTGTLVYEGGFAAGVYEGEGTLYQNGSVLYQGQFKNGQMEGEGKLFSGAQVIYEGGFSAGTFQGEGREYDPIAGRLLYDGSYVAGQYEGEGRKFDPETGTLVYEGGFYQGAYEGEGKSYDPQTQQPLYEGGFRAGRYDGQGAQYDPQVGVVKYSGSFLMGAYHGEGTMYDPATGFVTAAGQFRNGSLVVYNANSGTMAEIPETPVVPDVPKDTQQSGNPSESETPVVPDEPVTPDVPSQSEIPGENTAASVYNGPTAENGTLDVHALADMTQEQFKQQFKMQPDTWTVSDGGVLVYEDKTEEIGVSLRTDTSGETVSVDVWNSASVEGAKVGMTKQQMANALGTPQTTTRETLGEARMISISQSNRFFGRLTNLSPENSVEVQTYSTQTGTIRAVFASGIDQCLILEVLP